MCKLYKYNEFRNASYLVSFIICQYAIVNSYQSLSFIYLLFRTKFLDYCSLIKLDILCLFFKMYLNFILEINFICIYIKHLYIIQDRFFWYVCL